MYDFYEFLGYEPYWKRWLNGRTNKQEFAALVSLYDKYVDQLMKYIHEGILEGKQVEKLRTICPITDLNMV